MKDTDFLWERAQGYEKEHKYNEAAKAYLKAAQINMKNNKKQDAA